MNNTLTDEEIRQYMDDCEIAEDDAHAIQMLRRLLELDRAKPEPSAELSDALVDVLEEVLDKIPLTDSGRFYTPTAAKARAAIAAYKAKQPKVSAGLGDEDACRAAYENTYHKIKAAMGYDDWRMVWHKAKASAESVDSKRLSFLLTNIRTFHSIIFNGATPLMYKGRQLPVREAILAELDAAIAALEAKRAKP